MTEADYERIVNTSLNRFQELQEKREEIDVELAKLRQFLYAALDMIPEDQQERWKREIDAAVKKATAHTVSLAGAIRKIFASDQFTGWTSAGMRKQLIDAGFDFSSYTSNPLSSISTTLRRMADTGELKSVADAEGGTPIYFAADSRDMAGITGSTVTQRVIRGSGMLRRAAERSAAEKRNKKD